MKKLLLTRTFPAANIAAAAERYAITTREYDTALTEAEAMDAMRDFDVILCSIGDQFTAAALTQANTRCGMIANFGVGFNHIDIAAARAAGVAVSNTPDVVTDATADIAMTLIMMACRRAGEGERLVRSGSWGGWAPTQMLGTHVTGKRLGIIGMGRIGQAVAKRAHFGFDMPVIYFNRSEKEVDLPARQVPDLSALMSQSDIVVITVPGGNTHLVDAHALSQMQDGAVLINVARGDVLDESALIAELQAGRIVAGLDVYAHEPKVPTALAACDNAVLLPHLGTAALEVREAMGQMALDNIIAWDAGQPLLTPVTA